MPNYRVEIAITKNYTVVVEADDEDQAYDKAVHMVQTDLNEQDCVLIDYYDGFTPYYDGLESDTIQVNIKEVE